MAWHIPEARLSAWIEGTADIAERASVEQHVMVCDECQARTVAAADNSPLSRGLDLDMVWAQVQDAVEVSPPSRLERLFRAGGMSPADARIVAASPSLRGAWITAVTLVTLFAVWAPMVSDQVGGPLFLLLAPLVPVIAVGFAYGPESNPAFEQEQATPYPMLRLLLLRTAAVLAACLPLAVVGGLVLPSRFGVLWLLPAAAFVAIELVASLWLAAPHAALALTVAWCAVIGLSLAQRQPGAPTATPVLVVYLVIAAAGAAVVLMQRDRIMGVQR